MAHLSELTANQRLLLTIDESCRSLKISRSKLYDLIQGNEIKPVRIGRSVRFRLRDLEDFATRNVAA